MEELREPVHLFLLKSQFFLVRDRICGGDDAEPTWTNIGDGAHICFCSASSSVLRKKEPVELALLGNGHCASQVSLLPYWHWGNSHTHTLTESKGIKGKA